ncbi:hypothetical protein WJX73_001716 [Symbiochloris irregularis]|uniref:Uncharacterized protein n=1 Tax=Symbiochloris irregularis TaxID=706552 RepID=A0AAW1PJH2_9CHLO
MPKRGRKTDETVIQDFLPSAFCCEQLDLHTYERQGREVTERECRRLFGSKEFAQWRQAHTLEPRLVPSSGCWGWVWRCGVLTLLVTGLCLLSARSSLFSRTVAGTVQGLYRRSGALRTPEQDPVTQVVISKEHSTAPTEIAELPTKPCMAAESPQTPSSDGADSLIPSGFVDNQLESCHALERADRLQEQLSQLASDHDQLHHLLVTCEAEALRIDQERHSQALALQEGVIEGLKRDMVQAGLGPHGAVMDHQRSLDPGSIEHSLVFKTQQVVGLRAEVAMLRAQLERLELDPQPLILARSSGASAEVAAALQDAQQMARLLGQAEEDKDVLQREVRLLRQQLGLDIGRQPSPVQRALLPPSGAVDLLMPPASPPGHNPGSYAMFASLT